MQTTALIIVGSVTSGKTTLATKLAQKLDFQLVNEENTGNFFQIIHSISATKYPKAIYEHCYLYNQLEMISREYNKVYFYFLKVADTILVQNYSNRYAEDIKKEGDYNKIDPIQQQNMIAFEVKEWRSLASMLNNVFYNTLEINNTSDYDVVYERLLNTIK